LAGIFLGFHFATWITSLEFTTVASSVVLVTTAPLWVALLSPVFLNESINRWVFLGLVISLGGSVIVGLSGNCQITDGTITCSAFEGMFSGEHFWGNLLALSGAFLSAGYLMVGRKVRNSLDLSIYTFVVYSFAAIVLILIVFVTRSKISGYSPINYLWIFALAVIPQLIGHSAFNWALKYLSAAFVSIALLGEPVGTVILAYFFLAETPSVLEVVGGGMILAGIFLATRKKKIEPGDEDEDLL
jgi:drug/metabolite transporter (DMT)-like permease